MYLLLIYTTSVNNLNFWPCIIQISSNETVLETCYAKVNVHFTNTCSRYFVCHRLCINSRGDQTFKYTFKVILQRREPKIET